MKVSTVTSYVLKVPTGQRRFYSSQAAFPERTSLLVRVETDSGLVGWGEGGQYGPPEPVAACVDHVLAPVLIGRDPLQPVRLWEDFYSMTRDFGQKGTYIEALSALDIALWDLMGQHLEQPIYKLLGGGFRDRVQAYATGCYYTDADLSGDPPLEALRKEACSYVSGGFQILKVKIGLLSVEADVARLRTVREAVGPDINLLADANHAYTASTAIRIGRALEHLGYGWFEEPVPPEDHEGYRRVRQALNIPIAGGEAEFTRYGFRDLILAQCVDIIQPDLAASGGFSEWQKLVALSTTFNTALIPHVWGSGVGLAAALHAIAVIPPFPATANPIPLQNAPVVEYDRTYNPLRDELLVHGLSFADGYLDVPQSPGLGIEVDMDALERYRV